MDGFEEFLKTLSLDYLNLFVNGQAFSDVTFSVDGRMVHAHRCILAARSVFFRKLFTGIHRPAGVVTPPSPSSQLITVNSVRHEVFVLLLQFLYSGQVPILPLKHEHRPNFAENGFWHAHSSSAVDLAVDTISASRSFGVEQLASLAQNHLASIVDRISIEDVMKLLVASRRLDMQSLFATCSHIVARSGIPYEVLEKHMPLDAASKIEELRLNTAMACRSLLPHCHREHDCQQQYDLAGADGLEQEKARRMQRALDSSDVELVKLMVMGEGLDLDKALALHYAVENCSREVVKELLELGAAEVNHAATPAGRTPLHLAAQMVSPDMVAVLLDHHADPTVRSYDGLTPLDILRNLTSDVLLRGSSHVLSHIEPNKLRLCLELVQSAALVISREAATATPSTPEGYPNPSPRNTGQSLVNLCLDSRIIYDNPHCLPNGRCHG